MSHCKLRTLWPIHFKLRIVIGIDSFMVCILFSDISIFHSKVIGLYSSNCRWFFVWCAVNWEPPWPIHFKQLLELIVLWSVYFWVNLDFSFKSYGKESLYKYCMNVDDGHIMRSWRSCLLRNLLLWNHLAKGTKTW